MSNGCVNNLKFVEFFPPISIRDIGNRCQFALATDTGWSIIADVETHSNVLERFVLFSDDLKHMAIQYNFKPYEGGTLNQDGVVPVVQIYRLDKELGECKTTMILELTLDKPLSLFEDFCQLHSNLVVGDEELSFVYKSYIAPEGQDRCTIKVTYTLVSDTEWRYSSSVLVNNSATFQTIQSKESTMGSSTKDKIRDIFLRAGFTIKEGQSDLKPYVYEAAETLLKEFHLENIVYTTQDRFQEVDHLTPEENALLLDAQSKAQQHQKKVEYYTSLVNHLLNKPVE